MPLNQVFFWPTSALGFALLLVAFWLFYSICLVVYNVFFHPLSSFPGPKLAAASHLVHIYYTTTGTIVPWHEQMHREFGDVVRISPNELSFITEGTWKDVYTHRQGRPLMQKHVVFTRMAKADSLLIANDAAHTRGRKVLAHAFSDRALREQEPIIKSYVDLLISKLHGETRADSTVVNLMAWYNFTTFDIISDLCFAVSFGNLDNKDGHPFIRSMFLGFKWGALMGQASLYPPLNSIIKVLLPPSIKRKKQESFAGTQAKVRNRILQGSDRPDIMSRVLLYNDEKGLTRDEIDSNFLLLLAAGSETTATLLSGATYHLLKNPTALQQLNDEVRQAFHLETAITVAATEKLPVLNAVIQESLRMYPPVPVSLRRVVPPGGDTIDGRWVPGGTVVGVPQKVAYSSPRNFTDPLSFAPARWLEPRDPKYDTDKRDIVQPFSLGPRNCLGKNLAWAEMRLILARMVWNFDMDLVDKETDWADQPVFALYQKSPLLVTLTPRVR